MNSSPHFDIAIVGAGLAGLVCARQLQRSGYRTVVLEKSRGVGGRVATRRLHGTCVDHGLPFLGVQGDRTRELIAMLRREGVLHPWGNPTCDHSPALQYIAPTGMNAVAKFLATDLHIRKQQKVDAIAPTPARTWQLTLNDPTDRPDRLTAKAIAIAIPAPQILQLLNASCPNAFPHDFLAQLRAVTYNPCITVMAGYSPQSLPRWKALAFPSHPALRWVGLDSSKRDDPPQPVFVFHSTPQFAEDYLETADLDPAAHALLAHAAETLFSWMDRPSWLQAHRWRYALPHRPLFIPYLWTSQPLPLVCCGDWCWGNQVESALASGLAAAEALKQRV